MTEVNTIYLEMTAATELKPRRSCNSRFAIREATDCHWQLNRSFYFLVGELWAWIDKRSWSDEQWERYVASDSLRTFIATYDDSAAGSV